MTWRPIAAPALLATLTTLLLSHQLLSHGHVPQPYMDELFHVEQTRRYCNGEWSHWDPKITTLPGLYVCYIAYARLLEVISGGLLRCGDLAVMRSMNAVMYGLLTLAVALLSAERRSGNRASRAAYRRGMLSVETWQTLRIVAFPVLFFFSLLFYTDIGSTLFILWAYLFALRRHVALSAVCCSMAVLFRQTSIIWAAWIAMQLVLQDFTRECKSQELQERGNVVENAIDFMKYAWRNAVAIVVRYWPFALVGSTFVAFVMINNGIVVGDRDNHIVTWNIPQLFFFSVFSCVFMPGLLITRLSPIRIARTFYDMLTNGKRLVCTVVVMLIIVFLAYRFSYVHIFLLSDNRHYTFYLWRKLFKIHLPHQTRFFHALYSPIYLAGMYICVYLLRSMLNPACTTCHDTQ